MLAIRAGIFHSVTYASCMVVSLLVLSLSCIHYVLIKREGNTMRAAVIAFLAIDLLLILMNSAHIGIYITWFVVPLISLLFCDYRIYVVAVVLNYLMMTLSVWIVSPYYASLRVDFDRAFQYFAGRMGGFTHRNGDHGYGRLWPLQGIHDALSGVDLYHTEYRRAKASRATTDPHFHDG